jgi:hypothetical protein
MKRYNSKNPILGLLVLLIICVLRTTYVFSLDLAAWVEESDRNSNSVIGNIILSEDGETSLRIIRALGRREDPYMEDIIERIFYQHSQDVDEEYYLEVLLGVILKENTNAQELSRWTEANSKAYHILLSNLHSFSNPYLKAHIISILPYGMTKFGKSSLMSEARTILDEMQKRDGYLPPGRIKEVLAFFNTVEMLNDTVFLEVCVSFVELSRQRILVTRGRATVERLALRL